MFRLWRKRNSEAEAKLRETFQQAAIGPADCAHLCVDVQNVFAEKRIAKHIAATITPAFREAAIPNYWGFFSFDVDENGMPCGNLFSFCEVRPLPGDPVIEKEGMSTFKDTDLDNRLKQDKTRLVAITGFAFPHCVYHTALDALEKDYHVVMLTDGMESRKGAEQDTLVEKGAIFATSQEFFNALKAAAPC